MRRSCGQVKDLATGLLHTWAASINNLQHSKMPATYYHVHPVGQLGGKAVHGAHIAAMLPHKGNTSIFLHRRPCSSTLGEVALSSSIRGSSSRRRETRTYEGDKPVQDNCMQRSESAKHAAGSSMQRQHSRATAAEAAGTPASHQTTRLGSYFPAGSGQGTRSGLVTATAAVEEQQQQQCNTVDSLLRAMHAAANGGSSSSSSTKRQSRRKPASLELSNSSSTESHISLSTSSTAVIGYKEPTQAQLVAAVDTTANGSSSSSSSALQSRQVANLVAFKQGDGQLLQHQQRVQQAERVLLLGIDPDSCGAVAVVAADLLPYSGTPSSSSSSSSDTTSSSSTMARAGEEEQQQQQQQQRFVDLGSAAVSVYDMPVEMIPLRQPTKSSPQRYRRRLDISQAVALIKQLIRQQQQQQQQRQQLQQQQRQQSAGTSQSTGSNVFSSCSDPFLDSSNGYCMSSSSGGGGGNSSSCTAAGKLLLRAFLEVSSITPTNGSLAILNQGYSTGAWQAALLALGFEVATVHVKRWKKEMGLLGSDKDSSRQLAAELYSSAGQCQQHIISRKRDHGRAEALLIAAWGCGWSTAMPGSSSSSSSSSSGVVQQGALRDALQMDGGMHTLSRGTSSGVHNSDEEDLVAALILPAAAKPAEAPKAPKQPKAKRRSKKAQASDELATLAAAAAAAKGQHGAGDGQGDSGSRQKRGSADVEQQFGIADACSSSSASSSSKKGRGRPKKA